MVSVFEILFSEGVKGDLERLRPYDRAMILDAIQAQLARVPHLETKGRKRLRNLVPPFEAIRPIWQLRVGLFRVFYDVDEEERRVYVRAVRKKPPHRTTEEIL